MISNLPAPIGFKDPEFRPTRWTLISRVSDWVAFHGPWSLLGDPSWSRQRASSGRVSPKTFLDAHRALSRSETAMLAPVYHVYHVHHAGLPPHGSIDEIE